MHLRKKSKSEIDFNAGHTIAKPSQREIGIDKRSEELTDKMKKKRRLSQKINGVTSGTRWRMLIFVEGRLGGLESNKITLTDTGLTLVRVSNSQLRQSLFFSVRPCFFTFFYKVLSRNHVFSKPFFFIYTKARLFTERPKPQ